MKKSFIAAGAFLTSFFVFSSFAYAQSGTVANASASLGGIAGLITAFTQTIVKATGGLLMAAAMVAFFYGLVQYIWGARQGDPKKISDGNTFIKWSLVALFVMFSVYGIIKWTQSTLCPTCDWATITIPDLNFKSGSGGTTNGGATGGTGVGGTSAGNPLGGGGTSGGAVGGGSQGPVGALGTGCTYDSECGNGLVCSRATRTCVTPATPVGDGACNYNSDCVGNLICDKTINRCTTPATSVGRDSDASCQYASDCLGNLQCVDGRCK